MFSKLVVGFVLVCALVSAIDANPADCPQICPALYAPVCATDGRTYQEFVNPCQLKVSACNMYLSLATTHMDWCRTEDVGTLNDLLVKKFKNLDMSKPECLSACDRTYEPMCVSNGKYRALVPNKCMLDNFNCALGNKGK